jgi:hypothetical protein
MFQVIMFEDVQGSLEDGTWSCSYLQKNLLDVEPQTCLVWRFLARHKGQMQFDSISPFRPYVVHKKVNLA